MLNAESDADADGFHVSTDRGMVIEHHLRRPEPAAPKPAEVRQALQRCPSYTWTGSGQGGQPLSAKITIHMVPRWVADAD